MSVRLATSDIEKLARMSGAAMDRRLPRKHGGRAVIAAGVVLLTFVLLAAWKLAPRGMQVAQSELRIAAVQNAMLRNDIVVRSAAAPMHTVVLDVIASGRVEEIFVKDGALVAQGQLLFRLSNPQLRLDLVAREADRAQQISNLAVLRASLEGTQTDHLRRMLELKVGLAQLQRQHARYLSLAENHYVSQSMLEDSRDKLEQHRQAVEDERERNAIDGRIRRDGVDQMQQAIERLDAGLKVVNDSIEGLAVRAPIAGRLTDFQLQLGEIVKPEQRIGRIDDPGDFKLAAQIDEYFLGETAVGVPGFATARGIDYGVEVSRVFPQIKDGRFAVELLFTGAVPPGIKPGQSMDTRISLGEAGPTLLLPNDAFLNDSGGSWVFVVGRDGRTAERRAIRIGRRNNSQVEIISGLRPGERVVVSSYAAFGRSERLQLNDN